MSTFSEPVTKRSAWPQAVRSLSHKNFRLYWSGQVISQIGTWFQIVAQGWVVYELTDSAFMLGLVNFAALIPVIPVSLYAGVISDRYSRKKIILISEVVLLLQALIMAGLIFFGWIQVWHVIMLSFVLGAASALEQPARLAFIVDVVGKENLSNAVALNSAATNTARIIGPAIAGVVIAAFGVATCFLVNGISYLAVIGALVAIRVEKMTKEQDADKKGGGLIDGFTYLKRSPVLLGLLTIISLASFLVIPYISLMPVFARDVLNVGSQGLGFLLTSVGVGAIIGALLVANMRAGKRGIWLVAANILGPIFLAMFCFTRSYIISLILVAFVGASNSIRLTLANSLTQLNTDDHYHGRVMSVFNLLVNGMSRVGALVIGGFAEVVTISWALGISAVLSTAAGVGMIFLTPKLKKLP